MSLPTRVTSILGYWFGATFATSPVENFGLWYGGAQETDDHIRATYGEWLVEAEDGKLNQWIEQGPYDALALIVLLDQFGLNAYRDLSRGYEASAKAAPLTYEAIRRGYDKVLPKPMVSFLYMPLMHSEKLDDQEECARLFEALHGAPDEFATEHRDIIKKYGRFPGRNKVHARENTEAELEYLKNGGVF
ncbi:Hypothetical protein, putative [Bodo saltans]|uniref:Transmembrane protein n=1 Tax=Bodo saltans TaxID=75058 RepID=A0A0S4JQJ8_BODSA|nr:Hypothetical protein, putative [Bodo saltans]|eukprot:CUG92488.1 Hypothetical protein, putative [Bodo saltans]